MLEKETVPNEWKNNSFLNSFDHFLLINPKTPMPLVAPRFLAGQLAWQVVGLTPEHMALSIVVRKCPVPGSELKIYIESLKKMKMAHSMCIAPQTFRSH